MADDFDGDNDFDLMVSCWDSGKGLRFFENRISEGEGFVDVSKKAGVAMLTGGLNMVQADFDNDGDTDILVLRGAWLAELGEIPNSLLRNDGRGVFTDVTFAAGLAEVSYPTQTAAWFDYDNDGNLDIYIGNEQRRGATAPAQLFRNNADGTFSDVASAAGVAEGGMIKAVVCGDLDNDRWSDIVVSVLGGANRLYRNNRDGTFTNIAPAAGIEEPIRSFPAWIWDYDNDGNLDVFISSYTATTGDMSRRALGLAINNRELSGHYRGDGRGGFENMAATQGFGFPMLTMGCNVGDLDNDGYLDLYLGTGSPEIYSLLPNELYLNQSGTNFVDVTMASGLGHLQKGHAIAFADFDGDGDQEVFEQMGGAKRVDEFRDALFDNPGFGNHWIGIKLIGIKTNRSAIGTRVRVSFTDDGKKRTVYRHVDSGGSFGANPLQQHIGIGKADRVDQVEVIWPVTGEKQTFTDLSAGCVYEISEGHDEAIARGRPGV